jgi:hypothetical protein
MKPTKPAVLTLLAVPVFFCAGWLTGRHYRATQPLVRFTAEDLAGRPQHAARKVLDPLTPGASAIEPSDAPRWHWRPWPGERDAFEDAVRSATPSELKAIILSLGEPPEPAWAAQDLFRIWAERDPRGSRWYFEQLPPLSRFALMQDLIAGWAERDASSAVAWLTTQRSNATVSNARASVLSRIAKDDPEKAVELLRTTGWLHESPEAMRSIILTLIERDSAKAMQTWRELNLELNPPSTVDATPPVPPFTGEVIAWIMKDAEARSPQAIVEAIDLFTRSGRCRTRPSEPSGPDVAVIDVIDADQVRVTIRMFNGNAHPHGPLSEKVPCDSVLRAGSDDHGGGSTVPRFTRLVLAIRSWNQRSLCSFRHLEADCV